MSSVPQFAPARPYAVECCLRPACLPPSDLHTKVIESNIDEQAYLEVTLSSMLRPNIKMLAEVMLDTGDACTGIMLPVSSLAVLKACGKVALALHGRVSG